jgi:hypothetical protein
MDPLHSCVLTTFWRARPCSAYLKAQRKHLLYSLMTGESQRRTASIPCGPFAGVFLAGVTNPWVRTDGLLAGEDYCMLCSNVQIPGHTRIVTIWKDRTSRKFNLDE